MLTTTVRCLHRKLGTLCAYKSPLPELSKLHNVSVLEIHPAERRQKPFREGTRSTWPRDHRLDHGCNSICALHTRGFFQSVQPMLSVATPRRPARTRPRRCVSVRIIAVDACRRDDYNTPLLPEHAQVISLQTQPWLVKCCTC